jgi:hypothetical protein
MVYCSDYDHCTYGGGRSPTSVKEIKEGELAARERTIIPTCAYRPNWANTASNARKALSLLQCEFRLSVLPAACSTQARFAK